MQKPKPKLFNLFGSLPYNLCFLLLRIFFCPCPYSWCPCSKSAVHAHANRDAAHNQLLMPSPPRRWCVQQQSFKNLGSHKKAKSSARVGFQLSFCLRPNFIMWNWPKFFSHSASCLSNVMTDEQLMCVSNLLTNGIERGGGFNSSNLNFFANLGGINYRIHLYQ